MKSQLVLPLEDSQATLETVGGKGVSLARLKNVGLPVPEGFHITTDAYRQLFTHQLNQLNQGNCLAGGDTGHPRL